MPGVRFILKSEVYDAYSGAKVEGFHTIDNDVSALEAALRRGGYGSESGYEIHRLIGVELLPEGDAASPYKGGAHAPD